MLFNSLQFVIFFPLVTLIYFLLPHKIRWIHLLIASCVFYMAFIPVYILILFGTIIIDYVTGILIERSAKRKKYFLTLSIIANVGILCFFKYYNFFISNVNEVLNSLNIITHSIPLLNIILPLGLSFHTFQAMSYTIEVYRGNQKAERHLGIYALYVMFYPQLVAGPIERPQNLIHQFRERHYFDSERVSQGMRLMLLGFAKKILIADRIGILVGPVFSSPHQYPAISLFIAGILFPFQLYCDFSGYSDIAIGSAKVMGFELMKNFNWPYKSKNITEFWRRWHISLSTWLNDYLFIPISIKTRNWGIYGIIFSLNITFLIAGLWHGASWNFIVFGLLNGIALTYDVISRKLRKKISAITPKNLYINLSIVLTFLYWSVSLIFFRTGSLSSAFYFIGKLPLCINDMLISIRNGSIGFWNIWSITGVNSIRYIIVTLIMILCLSSMNNEVFRGWVIKTFLSMPSLFRLLCYYTVILFLFLSFLQQQKPVSFIYFQF